MILRRYVAGNGLGCTVGLGLGHEYGDPNGDCKWSEIHSGTPDWV